MLGSFFASDKGGGSGTAFARGCSRLRTVRYKECRSFAVENLKEKKSGGEGGKRDEGSSKGKTVFERKASLGADEGEGQ